MGLVTSTTRSGSLESLITDQRLARNSGKQKYNSYSLNWCSEALQNLQSISPWLNVSQRFTATLLDGSFHIVHKGQLELKLDRLTFQYKNINDTLTIYWPLSCVRWYGGCSDLFVFESGHRSKFGVGCFLFKCKKSRQLVSNIQKQTTYLARLQIENKMDISTLSLQSPVSSRSESVGSTSAETRSTLYVRSRSLTNSTRNSDQNSQRVEPPVCQPNSDLSATQSSDDYITLPNPLLPSNSHFSSLQNRTVMESRSTVYISYPQLMSSFSAPPNPTSSIQPAQSNEPVNINQPNDRAESTENNNYLVIVPSTHSSSCHCNPRQQNPDDQLSSLPPYYHPSRNPEQDQRETHSSSEENVDIGQYVIALASHTYVNQTPRLVGDVSQILVTRSSQNIYVDEPMTVIPSQS